MMPGPLEASDRRQAADSYFNMLQQQSVTCVTALRGALKTRSSLHNSVSSQSKKKRKWTRNMKQDSLPHLLDEVRGINSRDELDLSLDQFNLLFLLAAAAT